METLGLDLLGKSSLDPKSVSAQTQSIFLRLSL